MPLRCVKTFIPAGTPFNYRTHNVVYLGYKNGYYLKFKG